MYTCIKALKYIILILNYEYILYKYVEFIFICHYYTVLYIENDTFKFSEANMSSLLLK